MVTKMSAVAQYKIIRASGTLECFFFNWLTRKKLCQFSPSKDLVYPCQEGGKATYFTDVRFFYFLSTLLF